MSEEATTAPTAVSTGADASESSESSSEPDWSKIIPDNASGAETSRIMAEYKAKGTLPAAKEAPATNPIKEAAKEAARRHKIKVDGEEIEVDEDELKRGYSHQRVASKTLNEGKQLRKQAEEFAAMLKDPDKFFEVAEKLGHDVRSLTEKKLARLLEDELMDPAEKEAKLTKARLAEYERKDAEAKEEAKAKHTRELEKKYATEYETQFLAALKEAELPTNKPMIAEMAKYIGRAAGIGFKMTVSEAASLVKEDIKAHQARIFKDADAQTMLSILGEDLANKIRTHDISKLKSPEQFLRTPERSNSPAKPKQKREEAKPMSAADWARFRRS